MKKSKFTFIILFITSTIFATIGLQIYWNLKSYAENKIRVINEVQISFDNAVEKYYEAESKKNISAYYALNKNGKLNYDEVSKFLKKIDNWKTLNKQKSTANKIAVLNVDKPKPILTATSTTTTSTTVIEFKGKRAIDSAAKYRKGTEVIIMSVNVDTVNFKGLSKMLELELQRKNIAVSYAIEHSKYNNPAKKFTSTTAKKLPLKTESKSASLPVGHTLKLNYSDPTQEVLQRSLTGIILSLLLSLSIIACMVYLFKIINKQKKIDAIKNDLIGNITHEFKTPITTISSAIEGIKNFSTHNDVEKTNRYLAISQQQIQKLTHMVEKLLETASLDTDQLQLKKETVNLVNFLQMNIEKHKLFSVDKIWKFKCNEQILTIQLDAFHFENVISNLLDNALKYGGNEIEIELTLIKKNIEISVMDNGIRIEKEHQDKIFEQFYRIPKGNIHNVKGFGIGLYYSKKIVEKHGGTLAIVPTSKSTHFKIILAYEQN